MADPLVPDLPSIAEAVPPQGLPATAAAASSPPEAPMPKRRRVGAATERAYQSEPRRAQKLFLRVYKSNRPVRVNVAQPRLRAAYSRAGDRSVAYGVDTSQLRTYSEPDLPGDLNAGLDRWVEKPRDETGDIHSIAPILESAARAGLSPVDRGYRFVTFRNNLNKIFLTPYDERDGWSIDVWRDGGVVFLNVPPPRPPLVPGAEPYHSEYHKRTCYWGYKFESLATGGGDDDVVNSNEEWVGVLEAAIGTHKILMGAEIDCATRVPSDPAQLPSVDCMRELKTTRVLENVKSRRTFERHKTRKWWIQSFLAGVPKVVVGFRNNEGELVSTETYDTLQLPKHGRGAWDFNVCLAFGDQVLTWVHEYTVDGQFYDLQYDPSVKSVVLSETTREMSSFGDDVVERTTVTTGAGTTRTA